MTVENLICEKCKHKLGDDSDNWCKAFEDLPYEFPLENKHDKIIKGQTGTYVFEPK